MTSQSPRIYTYKITFKEVPYYYYGVHKEKKYNEEYWGSPKTHKWCWELYTPKKQILELFDYSDNGWKQAQEVETRLIAPVFNADKWCLNESCGGKASLELCSKNGKLTYEKKIGLHKYSKNERIDISRKGGIAAAKVLKTEQKGIYSLTDEERKNNSSKGGKIAGPKTMREKLGIFSLTDEQKKENASKGGKIMGEYCRDNKVGVFAMSKQELKEAGEKGGRITYEKGVGVHSLTTEQRRENIKKTNSQRWRCLETDFISTAAGLTSYQRAKGIDTSKRVRIV